MRYGLIGLIGAIGFGAAIGALLPVPEEAGTERAQAAAVDTTRGDAGGPLRTRGLEAGAEAKTRQERISESDGE